MMPFDPLEGFLKQLEESLPDMCRPKDLVAAGIFASEQMVYLARRNHRGPPYFKPPHKAILYPKAGVIDWLRNAKVSNG